MFSWEKFGLSGRDGADSTLWMGTRGAHTPCHQVSVIHHSVRGTGAHLISSQDSYGCNLVCQLVGAKQWTLFPPSASPLLSPTRVPYEESSVYSRVNMVSLERNYQPLLDKVSSNREFTCIHSVSLFSAESCHHLPSDPGAWGRAVCSPSVVAPGIPLISTLVSSLSSGDDQQ